MKFEGYVQRSTIMRSFGICIYDCSRFGHKRTESWEKGLLMSIRHPLWERRLQFPQKPMTSQRLSPGELSVTQRSSQELRRIDVAGDMRLKRQPSQFSRKTSFSCSLWDYWIEASSVTLLYFEIRLVSGLTRKPSSGFCEGTLRI